MMQQFKLTLVAGIVAILIFFSMEFYDRVSDEAQLQESVNIIDYEGYSEGINTIRFNAQGAVDYTLQAVRQISYKNAITELEDPLIQLYRGGDTHWNITANSGTITTAPEGQTSDEQIELIGEVEVYQLDSFGNRTVLTTDILSIDPAQEILNTESLVTMYSENHEQSAIGMRVNLNTDEYMFQREVRGRYAAESN